APEGRAAAPPRGTGAAPADETAAVGGARGRTQATAGALRDEPGARGSDLPRRHVVLPLRLGAGARRARAGGRDGDAPAAAARRRRGRLRSDRVRADAE